MKDYIQLSVNKDSKGWKNIIHGRILETNYDEI